MTIEADLSNILKTYANSFSVKNFVKETPTIDVLMKAFALTPHVKSENRQYWGRELGKCWERLIVQLCSSACEGYKPAPRIHGSEPCDLLVDKVAIDAKYRVGSGDAKTLRGFKANGLALSEMGYEPILLFVRSDNLQAAMGAFAAGGWRTYVGDDAFRFLEKLTHFDLKSWLASQAGKFAIKQQA